MCQLTVWSVHLRTCGNTGRVRAQMANRHCAEEWLGSKRVSAHTDSRQLVSTHTQGNGANKQTSIHICTGKRTQVPRWCSVHPAGRVRPFAHSRVKNNDCWPLAYKTSLRQKSVVHKVTFDELVDSLHPNLSHARRTVAIERPSWATAPRIAHASPHVEVEQ